MYKMNARGLQLLTILCEKNWLYFYLINFSFHIETYAIYIGFNTTYGNSYLVKWGLMYQLENAQMHM